ncbi:MAG: hypothetical protein AAGA57_07620 [Planctomycetota bacterium]
MRPKSAIRIPARNALVAVLLLALAPGSASGGKAPDPQTLRSDHPYRVTVELTEGRFAGWGYGSNPSKQTLDCVLFLREIVRELAERTGQDVPRSAERTLLIAGIDYAEAGRRLRLREPQRRRFRDDASFEQAHSKWRIAVLDKLVETKDPQIRGVQTALVEAGLGHAVAPEDIRAGDFVQYWYRSKKLGRWLGHSGVIGEIKPNGRIVLWGAHLSILADPDHPDRKAEHGGVGPSIPIRIRPDHMYPVRWGPAPE